MSPVLKRLLHLSGSLLALLGIIFVAMQLRTYGDSLDASRFGPAGWLALASLALVYGTNNLMLAFAWWNLLKQLGSDVRGSWAVETYGISQLARYVPGNIFHLAGRQALGMATGIPGLVLAKSSAWELALISVTGGLFGTLTLPLLMPDFPISMSGVLFVIVIGSVAILLWRMAGRQLTAAFSFYVFFLAISGLIFSTLVALQSGNSWLAGSKWLPFCGAYILSWLIGLITPGAPAGIGVRELVVLFLLKNDLNEADLLLAVLAARMVTVTGDLLFYGTAVIMKRVNVTQKA